MKISYQGRELEVTTPGQDLVYRCWSQGKFFELQLLERIAALNISGTYLDCGANLGNHSLFFGLFTQAADVVAFEPVPTTRQHLIGNTAPLGDRITIHPFALGDTRGLVEMDGPYGENTGAMHVRGPSNPRYTRDFGRRIPVEMCPLDTFDFRGVGLIKLDIEGYEHLAIRGARELMRRERPVLVPELKDVELRDLFEAELQAIGVPYRREGPYCATPTYIYHPEV